MVGRSWAARRRSRSPTSPPTRRRASSSTTGWRAPTPSAAVPRSRRGWSTCARSRATAGACFLPGWRCERLAGARPGRRTILAAPLAAPEDEPAGRAPGARGDEHVLHAGNLVARRAADLPHRLGDAVHAVDVRLAEQSAARVDGQPPADRQVLDGRE